MKKETALKTQPWTVKDGKVLSLTGKWWTPKTLLRKVQKQLKAAPRQYDQSGTLRWRRDDGMSYFVPREDCKTIGCIGGWCSYLCTGQKIDLGDIGQFISTPPLGPSVWPWLFTGNWADDGGHEIFSDPEIKKLGRKLDLLPEEVYAKRAKLAIKAIDLFIARGMR